MEPQEIGLLMLPVILFFALVINYFDQRFKAGDKPRPDHNTDRRDDTSAPL